MNTYNVVMFSVQYYGIHVHACTYNVNGVQLVTSLSVIVGFNDGTTALALVFHMLPDKRFKPDHHKVLLVDQVSWLFYTMNTIMFNLNDTLQDSSSITTTSKKGQN